jgi:hypothetical protein
MTAFAAMARRIPAELIALAEMITVFFAPVLFTNRIFLLWDLLFFFSPGYFAFHESVARGALPLWNPYVGCGEPLLADMELGIFYPPNLIYLVLPIARALVMSATFHVFLAGAGAYALARAWKISRVPSLLAGVLYSLNGFTISKLDFPSQLDTVAWFPLVLTAFILWLKRRTVRRTALLAGALCLQFLAGHPETMLFSTGALALYALFAGVHEWRTCRKFSSAFVPLLGLSGAGLVAILLSMAQLLPTWEALQLSVRAEAADQSLNQYSLHPLSVFSLLIPSIYGVPGSPGCTWAPTCSYYWLWMFYLGIAPIVILVSATIRWGLGHRAPRGGADLPKHAPVFLVPFLLTLGGVAFLYSTGKYTPFFELCLLGVPLLKWFSMPSKSLLCVTLSLSCLTAIAMDWLARVQDRGQPGVGGGRRVLSQWGTLLVFAAVALLVVACLVNDARWGKTILRRYFNLASVEPDTRGLIPWGVLLQDSVKLAVVGLLAAFLLRLYTLRPSARGVMGVLIVTLSFFDLSITHARLLLPGPAGILEERSAYLGLPRPDRKTARFLGYDPVASSRVARLLPEATRKEELDGTEFHGHQGDLREAVMRLARQFLHKSCPVMDKAFNANSETNFCSNDVARLTSILMIPQMSMERRCRLLAMLNCDRIVWPPNFLESATATGSLGATSMIHLDEPLPRAYVVGGVQILNDENGVVASLVSLPFDPQTLALIDSQQVKAHPDSFAGLKPGRVSHAIERLEYGQNSLEVDVRSQSPGLLVVSDTFYPGWHATVNARETPIHKVNGAFRGVRVPSGRSVVRMDYLPTTLLIGIAVSLATLTVLLVLVLPRKRVRPS